MNSEHMYAMQFALTCGHADQFAKQMSFL